MKDIKGYEGLYAVTKDGKVWGYPKNFTWHTGRFLKFFLIGNGYQVVCLYKDKKQKKFLVHRLVAQAYIRNPKNLREVNHKNANKLDNRATNLEWVSSQQNKQHAIALGLYNNLGKNSPKGSACKNAKLSDKQVKEIRKIYSFRKFTYKIIAKKFGISCGHVSSIINRYSWRHI